MKLDFLYSWVGLPFKKSCGSGWSRQTAKMYVDCLCGREFKSLAFNPILKLIEASL